MSKSVNVHETPALLSDGELADLEDLDENPHCVNDEEVLRRRDELASGVMTGLSRDEFRKACGR
jgi:hypothetical protein